MYDPDVASVKRQTNNERGETTMKATTQWTMAAIEKREQMLRELMSELCSLVEAGEMTDMQANEWYSMKADQWANGI